MPAQETIVSESLLKNNFHAVPLSKVVSELETDIDNGLSMEDASTRLDQYGPNMIPKAKESFWKVYLAPILNWLINIYLLSSFALVIIAYAFPFSESQLNQALFWLAIVAVNCLVAIFQQFRAQKKLEALEKLSAGDVRVIRNGHELQVTPDKIVPGDIIKLDQGDRVPADARVITCSNFSANEASLTGESVPVTKDANATIESDVPLTDMINTVFFGTYVSTGTARIVATTTGSGTEIGKIQGSLEQLNTGDIPLRRKVNLLAKYLGIAAVFLMVLSITWALFFGPMLLGDPIILDLEIIVNTLSAGITKAMTIMPINIPLLTTIVLLTGVLAMAKKGVIIRDLSAVESLGRVSVICSDKTGTMTRNEMTVKFIWDTEEIFAVTGAGYAHSGDILKLKDLSSVDTLSFEDSFKVDEYNLPQGLAQLLICGGINNDSEIVEKIIPGQGSMYIPMGDPTDAALLALYRKSQLNVDDHYSIVEEFPFDSEFKRMAKIAKNGDKHIAFVKGATEVLVPMCTMVETAGTDEPLTDSIREEIMRLSSEFAARGYRVISLAHREMDYVPSGPNAREQTERHLTYLGFAAIVDPARDGVREAVDACHSAGINVIMITGDASATAKTIAENLNIFKENSLVCEGKDIPALTDEAFLNVNVFARVNPEHKQIIVERYQDDKKVVAMTGDGVNDALALAMSDAGIAMGITGTDVAKEAADLVITDDSFASIVTGVQEGRGLFNKIRMMVYFYIAINLFESIIFFGALFLLPAGFNMLTSWQSLYLVATTHSFPGLALVFDKTSPRAMEEKPRDSEDLITRGLAKLMGLNVVLMVIGAAVVYWMAFTGFMGILDIVPENLAGFYSNASPVPDQWNLQIMKATTMLLTIILIVESVLVLIIRRINLPAHEGIREPGIERFAVLLGLIYLAHLLLMYIPEVQLFLATAGLEFYIIPLTAFDWLVCILASLPAILGMEIYKRSLRKKGIFL